MNLHNFEWKFDKELIKSYKINNFFLIRKKKKRIEYFYFFYQYLVQQFKVSCKKINCNELLYMGKNHNKYQIEQ